MEKKKIRLAEIMPVIEEKLSQGSTVEIPITGTSMLPLLVAGRDTVVLKKCEGKLKKYDLPLYRRADGSFVLHRVVEVCENSYTMCGDNQWVKEKGVTDGMLIGTVCTVKRNGREIPVAAKKYRAYCRIWNMLFPIRKYIVKIRGKLKK